MKTSVSRVRLRWTARPRSAASAACANEQSSTRPSATDAVSRSSATMPVPRVRYQNVLALPATSDQAPTSSAASRRRPATSPLDADETRRQPPVVEPAGAACAEHDRSRAAMLASTHVAAATWPSASNLLAGRPVAGRACDAASPAAVRQRRTVVLEVARPPVLDRHDRAMARRAAPLVLGDPDRPAAPCLSGNRDVATERDEHAAAVCSAIVRAALVGRPCLGGRAEVELDTARYPQRQTVACRARRDATARAELGAPRMTTCRARGRARTCGRSRPPAADRRASGRRTRRSSRPPPAPPDQLGEQRRDRERRTGPCVHPLQLRVRAEAAARQIEALQLLDERRAGIAERRVVGDGDNGGRPKCCERRCAHGLTSRPRRRPAAHRRALAPWRVRIGSAPRTNLHRPATAPGRAAEPVPRSARAASGRSSRARSSSWDASRRRPARRTRPQERLRRPPHRRSRDEAAHAQPRARQSHAAVKQGHLWASSRDGRKPR